MQLPGRENRWRERPLEDCEEAVGLLAEALAPYTDRPFAFFGHSMGALLAHRPAHEFGTVRGAPLRHLFVAACTSPSLGPNPLAAGVVATYRALGLAGLPSAAELLDVFDGQPERLRHAMREHLGEGAGEQLLGVMDPVGCADLRIVHGYARPTAEAPLAVPVTALHGRRDPLVTEEGMSAWQDLTAGTFRLEVFDGDHYFCHPDQARAALLALLRTRLAGGLR
ncbi:hypothetical protein K6I34_005028 [Streptomyces sp. UNOC14_S4]|nr:hypothetical protein [Streptomyces sp. UNOC14_S4]